MCQREICVFFTFPVQSLKIYCHATSSVFYPLNTLIVNSKTSVYDLSEETLTWCVKTNCSRQQQGDTSSDISVDAFCWCCYAGSSEKPLCPLWLLSAGMIKKNHNQQLSYQSMTLFKIWSTLCGLFVDNLRRDSTLGWGASVCASFWCSPCKNTADTCQS